MNEQARTIHRLKCYTDFYQEVKSGRKNFELRRDDRNYKVGDILLLRETTKSGNGEWIETGEYVLREITYVFRPGGGAAEIFGLDNAFCILSIRNGVSVTKEELIK
ncbi:MAG: DUF3850 domain-containing protein [Proteobacteria bacterium]|nr:DUF3850 domain-containing protein [Pseudomonadota bacterium]